MNVASLAPSDLTRDSSTHCLAGCKSNNFFKTKRLQHVHASSNDPPMTLPKAGWAVGGDRGSVTSVNR